MDHQLEIEQLMEDAAAGLAEGHLAHAWASAATARDLCTTGNADEVVLALLAPFAGCSELLGRVCIAHSELDELADDPLVWVEAACHEFEKALAAYQTLGSRPKQYECLMYLGSWYFKLGQYYAAEVVLDCAWQLCCEAESIDLLSDPVRRAMCWFYLGLVYGVTGRCRDAVTALQEALSLYLDNSRWALAAETFHALGEVFDLVSSQESRQDSEQSL